MILQKAENTNLENIKLQKTDYPIRNKKKNIYFPPHYNFCTVPKSFEGGCCLDDMYVEEYTVQLSMSKNIHDCRPPESGHMEALGLVVMLQHTLCIHQRYNNNNTDVHSEICAVFSSDKLSLSLPHLP
ncbi:hypothetical protein PAMP_011582 [Pampus punctatissimus]